MLNITGEFRDDSELNKKIDLKLMCIIFVVSAIVTVIVKYGITMVSLNRIEFL